MAKRDRSAPMSLESTELAALVAGAVAVLAAVTGVGFGIWFMLAEGVGLEYGRPVTTHPQLGLGFVVVLFGLLIAVVAGLVALLFRSQARPRRHALRVAAAAERARLDEL